MRYKLLDKIIIPFAKMLTQDCRQLLKIEILIKEYEMSFGS